MAILDNNAVFGHRFADDPNYPVPFELENAAGLREPLSTRISMFALNGAIEMAKWGACGAIAGGAIFGAGAFALNALKATSDEGLNEEDNIDVAETSKTGAKLGAMIGGGVAFFAHWYKTRDFQIRLEANFQNAREEPGYSERARNIFNRYLETIDEMNDGIVCPISLEVYIYPVKAEDGHVYEYQNIVNHIREFENRLMVWNDYEQTRLAALQGNPPVILAERDRPFSSPFRGTEISINGLELDVETMNRVTDCVKCFFKKMKVASQDAFEGVMFKESILEYMLSSPRPQEGFEPLQINDQTIVQKIVAATPLSQEEAFYVHDIFHHYANNIFTRNQRIRRAITDSLTQQEQNGSINALQYSGEQERLMQWYRRVCL